MASKLIIVSIVLFTLMSICPLCHCHVNANSPIEDEWKKQQIAEQLAELLADVAQALEKLTNWFGGIRREDKIERFRANPFWDKLTRPDDGELMDLRSLVARYRPSFLAEQLLLELKEWATLHWNCRNRYSALKEECDGEMFARLQRMSTEYFPTNAFHGKPRRLEWIYKQFGMGESQTTTIRVGAIHRFRRDVFLERVEIWRWANVEEAHKCQMRNWYNCAAEGENNVLCSRIDGRGRTTFAVNWGTNCDKTAIGKKQSLPSRIMLAIHYRNYVARGMAMHREAFELSPECTAHIDIVWEKEQMWKGNDAVIAAIAGGGRLLAEIVDERRHKTNCTATAILKEDIYGFDGM